MTEVQEERYNNVVSYIKRQGWVQDETDEGTTRRINVRHGTSVCIVKFYSNGTVQLKASLEAAKNAVENNEVVGELLPFEIERFPEVLLERIPDVDPVVVRFMREAIICMKANSLLGCAFLLGGASEKIILLLVDTYANAIEGETHQSSFKSRTSNKFISKVYDEFKRSFKSSSNKPEDYGWTHDLEIKIEHIFTFCRICRNESGHPHLPPNLDKGVLLANMGQFVKYTEDVYSLIKYYQTNKAVVGS